jgi:sugar (pentulose or hexulose) kinase
MLPYLAGERAPFLEPAATGAYVGVTPHTTVADFAKATVEGISFALRMGLEAVGGASGSLVLTGGGAQRPEWCQLVADVTSRVVEVDAGGESSLRGVVSLVPGFASLAGPRGPSRATYRPGPSAGPLEDRYQEFLTTLLAFRGLWKQHGEI